MRPVSKAPTQRRTRTSRLCPTPIRRIAPHRNASNTSISLARPSHFGSRSPDRTAQVPGMSRRVPTVLENTPSSEWTSSNAASLERGVSSLPRERRSCSIAIRSFVNREHDAHCFDEPPGDARRQPPSPTNRILLSGDPGAGRMLRGRLPCPSPFPGTTSDKGGSIDIKRMRAAVTIR